MPRLNQFQVNIRVDKERYMYLHGMENYTQYIIDLIDNDRLAQADPEYLQQKENELKSELKKIQDLKKVKPQQKNKIQECIKYWYDVSKNQFFKDQEAVIRFCEKRVMPNLKKLGYQGSAEDVADILINMED